MTVHIENHPRLGRIEVDTSDCDTVIVLTVSELTEEAYPMELMEKIKEVARNIVSTQGKVKAGVTQRQTVKHLI